MTTSNSMILDMFVTIQIRSDPLLAQNGFPLDLKCYNLPFGALGFISHILTYYTIVCLWYDKRPLWPFHKLTSGRFDLVLSFAGLAVCIVTCAITIKNCKNSWQLLLIAVWKLSMSVLNGLTGMHVSMSKFRSPGAMPMKTKQAAWWLLLYAPGMVAGLIGLMSLVSQTISKHPGILWLSIAFLAIFAAAPFVSAITMMKFYWKDGGISLAEFLWTVFVVTSSIFIALSAFYSDWCLGLILGHLKGVPSSDNAPLFWTYFVAKRLTLLSR